MNLREFNAGRRPAPRMLHHSASGCYAIIHFGLNTYTDKEWGYGGEDPALFAPEDFDAEEIVKTCKECGLDGLILVCKHHDGFCLWPTATTTYNISRSLVRGGKGDLVREFSDACRKHGINMGFYVSPWDRNHPGYGKAEYPAIYREQLREIYSNYGLAFEAWFDGANGGDGWYGGACETRSIDRTTYYDWDTTWKLIRRLQPGAAIFSDVGPDLRWVGNEKGLADPEAFACYTPHSPESGTEPAPGCTCYQEGEQGHPDGLYHIPPECDVPLRGGWFYHSSDDARIRSVGELVEIYLRSVGCGGFLNLGLAPNRNGRLASCDVSRLHEWKRAIDALFTSPVLKCEAPLANGSCMIEFPRESEFNLLELAESMEDGEKILRYEVQLRSNGVFHPLISGKAVGCRRLKKLPGMVRGDALLIRILESYSSPLPGLRVACYAAEFPEESATPDSAPDYRKIPHRVDGMEWICELDSEMPIKGFVFTPEGTLPEGTPDRYELFLSADGKDWHLVSEGEFSNLKANPLPQKIAFEHVEHARFCRLRATRMLVPGIRLAGIESGVLTVPCEKTKKNSTT